MTRASRLQRCAAWAVAAAAFCLASPVSPAAAKDPSCSHHAGELTRSGGGVLWTRSGYLWVCTAYYGDPAVSKRLGPWTSGSKAAFDGSTVAWTVRSHPGGTPVDRIWVADGPYSTWLRDVQPVPGTTAATSQRVSRLAVSGGAAAWVTTRGAVVLAVQSPSNDPEAYHPGTPGLASPLKPYGHRLVVGTWPAAAGPAFSDTLSLKYTGGDGDECGGTSTYRATVRPVPTQPRAGASWDTDWTSTSVACRG